MVTEPRNAHNCMKISYTLHIVCLLHVSAPFVAISREMHHKKRHIKKLQTFVNQPTDIKY